MQGSNTFIFEELDQPSKDYLLAIGKNKGNGFPGVYVGKSNSWWCFLVAGFVFLGAIPVVNFADTFAEPKAQAMLQTALLLVVGGSWCYHFVEKVFFLLHQIFVLLFLLMGNIIGIGTIIQWMW